MTLEMLESLVLADDRKAALGRLTPGTDDHYYFHCLDAQARGDLDLAEALLSEWSQRSGSTLSQQRRAEIEARQLLLRFDRAPAEVCQELARRLGVGLDHRREDAPGEAPKLPHALPPELLDQAALDRRALERPRLEGFEDHAMERLVATASSLDAAARDALVERLQTVTVPGLVGLLAEEIERRGTGWLGKKRIAGELLIEQLDELRARVPSVGIEPWFVKVYLRHIRLPTGLEPDADADAHRAAARRIWAFVEPLPPAFTAVKAAALQAVLRHDLARGEVDRGRVVAYLSLPRRTAFTSTRFLERHPAAELREAESDELVRHTGLGPTDDRELITELLDRLFVASADLSPFDELLDRDFVRRRLAESRLLSGQGGEEALVGMLGGPEAFGRLRDRVEVDFAPENRAHFGESEPVSLTLRLKNVKTLVVKVFEINALGYYLSRNQEITTALDLDGLVASSERTFALDTPPLVRELRTFDFPELARPGVFVIDFIGGGLSSRALVRKGQLDMIDRPGPDGHVITVLDEKGLPAGGASVHVGGREFPCGSNGQALVPYTTSSERRAIVLRRGPVATRHSFVHQAESFSLSAGIHLEREGLLRGRTARLLVRLALFANGCRVSAGELRDLSLTIATTDQAGTASSREIRGLVASDDAEIEQSFRVPDGLSHVQVTVRAKVKKADGTMLELSEQVSHALNGIEATWWVAALLLSRSSSGYALSLLGKAGEARRGVRVDLTLHTRDHREAVTTALETDEAGRIALGALPGVLRLEARCPLGEGVWSLPASGKARLGDRLHGRAGEPLRLPYAGSSDTGKPPSRRAFSLVELHESEALRDRFDALSFEGGWLVVGPLPAGDYGLALRESNDEIVVSVGQGEAHGGWLVGNARPLELSPRSPLTIERLAVEGESVVVKVAGGTRATRVALLGTRYLPEWPSRLSVEPRKLGEESFVVDPVRYASGRDIGDEYRYVLERRYAPRYPGNMLPRPGLLLNPWEVSETRGARAEARGGGGFGGGSAKEKRSGMKAGSTGGRSQPEGGFVNLDFLGEPAVVLGNLRPDARGEIRVPLSELGGACQLRAVAMDETATVERELLLPERPASRFEVRLARALSPGEHFVESSHVTVLQTSDELTVEGAGEAELEAYDSLARVHALFSTLSGGGAIDEFSFVLGWPSLSRDEKLALYDRHACHELHFFVARKDPGFFAEVVAPYLESKRDKTFVDRYLLGHDLSRYLELSAFERLTLAEQILLEQRVYGPAGPWARRVVDLAAAQPTSPDERARVFRAALRGRALEGGEGGGPGGLAGMVAVAAAPRRRGSSLGEAQKGARADATPQQKLVAKEAPPELDAFMADEPEPYEPDGGDDVPEVTRRGEGPGGGKPLFRKLDETRELAESHYRKARRNDPSAGRVHAREFWRDVALHDGRSPFVPASFALATSSFTEMMLALSLLDLPFSPEPHQVTVEGGRATLRAGGPCVVFHRGIALASPPDPASPVLLGEALLRASDRFERDEQMRQREKPVRGELLSGEVYVRQVVVTNRSSTPVELDVLRQIPEGAVPVASGFTTRSDRLSLGAYATQVLENAFYFPEPRLAPAFPAHASAEGRVLAAAEPQALPVVERFTEVDRRSWEHLSQRGSDDEVLAALETESLDRIDLEKIAFRMRDRSFYDRALEVLDRRRHLAPDLRWYALVHRDAPRIRQMLRHEQSYLRGCGLALDGPIARIDPVDDGLYEHLEYAPLVHARAHRLGGARTILNRRLAAQYERLLKALIYRASLGDDDRLELAYYLLLQDRIDEGRAMLARVDPAKVETRLQLDYLRVYEAFFTPEPERAREIALGHRDHPVPRWRALFRAALAQLDEARAGAIAGDEGPGGNDREAASAPSIALSAEGKRLRLDYQNLSSCTLSFYKMDVELLFSRQPFAERRGEQLAFVAPNLALEVVLPAGGTHTVQLPAELESANLTVEAEGQGARASVPVYAHDLRVQLVEPYAQARVARLSTGAPLPAVYVKVYARTRSGEVRFHKDGYTDLRGRFDYASVSGPGADVERFAILFLSPEHGAVTREAGAPLS